MKHGCADVQLDDDAVFVTARVEFGASLMASSDDASRGQIASRVAEDVRLALKASLAEPHVQQQLKRAVARRRPE